MIHRKVSDKALLFELGDFMTQISVSTGTNSVFNSFFGKFLSRASLLVLVSAIGTGSIGCSKKKAEDEQAVPNSAAAAPTAGAASNDASGDSDTNKAMGLKTVHFAYDSFALSGEEKEVLKNNGEILKTNTSLKIQIEGHCDARGGIQYNIALGEKRANATKKFLEDLGIQGDRVTTISFGKERLLDTGSTEEAHAKNRRANFVITSK